MRELKPCPFCGGVANLAITELQTGTCEWFNVFCENGCCSTGKNEMCDEVVETWNSRAEIRE